MNQRILLLFAVGLSLFYAVSAEAGIIIYVDASAPPPGDGLGWATAYTDLQDALSVANPSDEIWVANGTYIPGVNPTDTFQLIAQVEIYGGFAGGETQRDQRNPDPLTNGTVLSGDVNGDGQPDTDIIITGAVGLANELALLDGFTIKAALDTAVLNNESSPTLQNLLITLNQSFGSGAAIRNLLNSSPDIRDCTFTNNLSSNMGGAMFNSGSSRPIITGCTFSFNSAAINGGAIFSIGSSDLQLTDCTFDGNSASGFGGGGIYLEGSEAELRRCTFTGNQAPHANGGAMHVNRSNDVKLIDCSFVGNSCNSAGTPFNHACNLSPAGGNGGGAIFTFHDSDGALTLVNCSFIGNRALQSADGGALKVRKAGVVEMTNCLFSGNTAHMGGGLASFFSNATTITNCTFSENDASVEGGGIFLDTFAGNPFDIRNSILWGNTDGGAVIQDAQFFVCSVSTPSVQYSCIQDADPGAGSIPFGGATNNNIDDDPLFADFDGADNTVGTQDDDLRLLTGSPCIDTGNDPDVPPDNGDIDEDGDPFETTPLDLDLFPRFIDASQNAGQLNSCAFQVDMGVYEFRFECAVCTMLGDMNFDGLIDGRDIQPFVDCLLINGAACACHCGDLIGQNGVEVMDIPCFVVTLLTGDSTSCETTCTGASFFEDCNQNGTWDTLDVFFGTSEDCNDNGVPDECDISSQSSGDVNGNGIPDECDPDCNANGVPDDKDIADGTSIDVNSNGVPDECDPDCNGNGIPDDWDISQGTSADCNNDGVPDDCEEDCNGNGVPDDCDIDPTDPDGDGLVSADCNGNNWPDECDLAVPPPFGSLDCDNNGVPDECDIAGCLGDPACGDCNGNGVPDACDISSGISADANSNGIPDECESQQAQSGGSAPTPESVAAFYEWCFAQEWGPHAGCTCSEQFQGMVNMEQQLGLPLGDPKYMPAPQE